MSSMFNRKLLKQLLLLITLKFTRPVFCLWANTGCMSCPVSCFYFYLTLFHGRNFDSKTKTDLSHTIHHNKMNQVDLAAGVFATTSQNVCYEK